MNQVKPSGDQPNADQPSTSTTAYLDRSKSELADSIRFRTNSSAFADASAAANRNKKATSWFNFLPPYKVRAEEFKRHFGHIVPSNERFIVDYSCAYQREILAQGRMYISLNYICFYANIFSWETNLVIKCKDIKQIYKTNTALFIPNAIEIVTNSGDKYFFASYVSREKAYSMLFKIWQNALLDVKLDAKEILETNKLAISQELIWDWIHEAYGNYLGYTEEEEKLQKSVEEKTKTKNKKKSSLINADSDSTGSDSDLYLDSDTFNEMNSKQLLDSKLTANGDAASFSCCCDDHAGTKIFTETFPLTVDQMFTLAFDDSPFFRMMKRLQKSTILSCEPWRDLTTGDVLTNDEPSRDDESRRASKKQREVKFRMQIDNALAKMVEVCETQVLDEKSEPGYFYMLLSKAQNSGVPFADTFHVYTQYCFARGATIKECTLTVHVKVDFVKSSFGLSLLKGTIESSSVKGATDYCNLLRQQLHNWCKEKSLERRQTLNFQQYKQLQYDSSNEDNRDEDDDENDELDDDDADFVLSNDSLMGDLVGDSPLIKTNSINRKVFDSKRKRFKSSSISTINSARLFGSGKQSAVSSPFWKFKNNELILFVIFIILLLILILILFLFKRLWQLEIIIRKYEDDLMNFEHLIKLTTNLSQEESFRQFFSHSNTTVLNLAETWRDLINQTESTIQSIKSIYLEKTSP